jgi:hypothetical protein
MFEISFQSNVEQWKRDLDVNVAKQVPFATSLALNKTAVEVKEHHLSMLPMIFDRPTRYTLNSLQAQMSNKQNLRALVYFRGRNPGNHYLMPQVEGGGRPHKRFEYWLIQRGLMASNEYAVPASGMSLDAYGNIRPGVITMILSQLAAGPDPFQWETAKSRARAKTTRVRYFVPPRGSNLRRGVWKRTGKHSIQPVLIFVSGVAYEKRYRFAEISRTVAEMRFPINFQGAMSAAILTSAPGIGHNLPPSP